MLARNPAQWRPSLASLAATRVDVLDRSGQLDLMFADSTRRALVERLSKGPASVSDLALALAISLPAVMRHVQVLEASGLVRSLKIAGVRNCRVEPKALAALERWASNRRAGWERRFGRLGRRLPK